MMREAGGDADDTRSTDVESPYPPLILYTSRVCMSIHTDC